ncbi:oxidoreductase [Hymenopellis radicata]|nr:oxidoreductase [Hymenopellis radicata]
MFLPKQWDPREKHCYVTGGTAGLGLSLAVLLTQLGANVSVIGRNKERLAQAVEKLENARENPAQKLHGYSYDMNDGTKSAEALEEACRIYDGRCPDAVFCCAGSSTPGFFVEQDEASMRKGMDQTYWVQTWTAMAASKMMVKQNVQGKIIFVSSYLGYMSMIGYSTYAPGKHALRGLAETLRSELQLYDISVHIFFPGTIYSPGLEEENKTKPKITLKIEEDDTGMTPDQCAAGLLAGVRRGYFHITADFVGDLFRTSTRGTTPYNNVFMDCLKSCIGCIGLFVWRRQVDGMIQAHKEEHSIYLREVGAVKRD